MSWMAVTIPRRAGVGMPARCAYCFGTAEQDLLLRARREAGRTTGRLTTTRLEEHFAVEIPFCRAHAARSAQVRKEIRVLGIVVATLLGLFGLVAMIAGFDAPLGVRIFFGIVAGAILALLGLLAVGLSVRRLPRYRDWGAGLLGVDLAAGAEALTFRFTNKTFAAAFRTRNGLR